MFYARIYSEIHSEFTKPETAHSISIGLDVIWSWNFKVNLTEKLNWILKPVFYFYQNQLKSIVKEHY